MDAEAGVDVLDQPRAVEPRRALAAPHVRSAELSPGKREGGRSERRAGGVVVVVVAVAVLVRASPAALVAPSEAVTPVGHVPVERNAQGGAGVHAHLAVDEESVRPLKALDGPKRLRPELAV